MDAIRRGWQAKELLGNETLKEALESQRSQIVALMEEAAIGDVQLHHELVLSLQSIKAFRRQLEKFVRDGQYEESKSKG